MHDERMASDADVYWERRRELTPSPERPALADGDRRLALFVRIADPAIVAAYERLRARLDGFPCLETPPNEGLHVTVKLFDCDPTVPAVDPDGGISAARIDEAVGEVAADHDPFDVAFPRLNLFPDVVYAEVDAGGALAAINRALCDRPWATVTDRDADTFVPHLTLGYFTDDEEYDRLIGYLEDHRDPGLPTTTVTELTLVTCDLASGWRSTATTLRTYPL